MQVKDIMSSAVISLLSEDSVQKAASLICLRKISGIPVVDEEMKFIGMLSEKDILRAIYPSYREFYDDPAEFRAFEDLSRRYDSTVNLKVKDIFTRQTIAVEPETPVLKALSLMVTKRIRRLPVVDETGKLIGIISQGDVHQALFNEHFHMG
ncbi:inosine-5'-monophosphate dehydrogenase [Peptococcaceae bacterium CEB3]|nr:inosine-5'-monophosphate dehydrogenase [Peptococcaceae bacterium CEB3]